MKFFKFIIVPALIMTGAISCNKNEIDINPHDSVQITLNSKIITNKLGILEFKDFESFRQTVSELKDMSKAKKILWEKEHNFISLESIYDVVLKDESEILKNIKNTFKDVSGVERSDFPNTHSNSFKKYSNSLVSTGESIIDIPLMNINIVDYANVVNKDGFVRIKGVLFQFKKDIIKIGEVKGEVSINDLDDIGNASKNESRIQVLASNRQSNKQARILQNGSKSCIGGLGRNLAIGIVDYSDTFIVASEGDPGAFAYTLPWLSGFSIWLVPAISYQNRMNVVYLSWWGGGFYPESNCKVAIAGTSTGVFGGSNTFGTTNGDGNFSISHYVRNASVANLNIINTGFYIFRGENNNPNDYPLICSIFEYL